MRTLTCELSDIVHFFDEQGEFFQLLDKRSPNLETHPITFGKMTRDLAEIRFDNWGGERPQIGLTIIFQAIADGTTVVSSRIRYRNWFWFYTFTGLLLALICMDRIAANDRPKIFSGILIGSCLLLRMSYWGSKKHLLELAEAIYQVVDIRFNNGYSARDISLAEEAALLVTSVNRTGKPAPGSDKNKAALKLPDSAKRERSENAAEQGNEFFYEIKEISQFSRTFSRCYYRNGQKICTDSSFGGSDTRGAVVWEKDDRTTYLVYWSEFEISLRCLEGMCSGISSFKLPGNVADPTPPRVATIQGSKGEMKIYTAEGKFYRYNGSLNGPY